MARGLLLLAACSSSAPQVYLGDLTVLDDGSVILAWEANDGSRLGRMGLDGELRWESRAIGKPPNTFAGTALTTHDRVVAMREAVDPRTKKSLGFHAFDLVDGRHRWSIELGDADGSDHNLSHARTPTSMIERWGNQVIAFDPETGRERYRGRSESDDGQLTVVGEHVVIDGNDLAIIDPAGRRSNLEGIIRGCVADGTYYGVEWDRHTGDDWLVRLRPDELGPSRVRLVKDDDGHRPRRCYAHNKVLAMEASSFWGRTTSRMQFFTLAGEPLSQLGLPGESTTPFLEIAPDPKREVRFVVLAMRRLEPRGHWIALVDLARQRLVWSREVDQAWSVFRVGAIWYIFEPISSTIAAIDGDSGELRGAVRIDAAVRHIGPENIGGGSLWLGVSAWAPHHPVTRLDATSLVVTLPSGHIPVRDARDTPFLKNLPSPD